MVQTWIYLDFECRETDSEEMNLGCFLRICLPFFNLEFVFSVSHFISAVIKEEKKKRPDENKLTQVRTGSLFLIFLFFFVKYVEQHTIS